MPSTGDIQFFVCRSRNIPEPPFPSQGIAGSGNEIVNAPTAFQTVNFDTDCDSERSEEADLADIRSGLHRTEST